MVYLFSFGACLGGGCSGHRFGLMYIKTRDGKTSTLRALFQRMAPLAHHFDPQQSQVLAHIAEVLGCDLGEAQRCFNSMRQGKVGVLRFNRAQAAWHGCEWVSDDEEESKLEVARCLGAIDKRLMKLEAAQRRMPKGAVRKEGDGALDGELDGLRNDLDAVRAALEEMQKTLSALADKVKSIDGDLTTVYGRVGESEAQIQHLSKGVSVPLLDLYAAAEIPASETHP